MGFSLKYWKICLKKYKILDLKSACLLIIIIFMIPFFDWNSDQKCLKNYIKIVINYKSSISKNKMLYLFMTCTVGRI